MHRFSPLLLSSLTACYPNVATDGRVDALEDRLLDVETRLESCEGELLTAQDRISALESNTVWVIDSDTTFDVASGDALNTTLKQLDHARIAGGVTVTIDLADGPYDFTEPLTVDHPDGSRIHLIGNTDDPEAVDLAFRGSDGVVVPPGRGLGLLAGFDLSGDGTAGTVGVDVGANATLTWGGLRISDFGRSGVRVKHGGTLRPEDLDCGGDHIETSDMVYGFEVSDGGRAIVCDSVARDMRGAGFYAAFDSYLSSEDATSEGNEGDGFYVAYGSTLVASGATTSGNGGVGFEAQEGSVMAADAAKSSEDQAGFTAGAVSAMSARASTVTDSKSYGFYVHDNSTLDATEAKVNTAEEYGFIAVNGSVIDGQVATVTGAPTGWYASTQSYIYAYNTRTYDYTDIAFRSDNLGVMDTFYAEADGSGEPYSPDVSRATNGYAWY